jgi:hypothetical protein
MIRLKNSYNLDRVRLEIDHLVEEHGWWQDSQISLQSPDGNFHEGNGKIEWSKYSERDLNQLNVPDDWEIARFIRDNDLYRTRIMKLKPKQCYSIHKDRTPRIHLVTDTDPHCLFILNNKAFHVPADGYAYYIDTTQPHTALNGTLDFERIHIVGCTDKEPEFNLDVDFI